MSQSDFFCFNLFFRFTKVENPQMRLIVHLFVVKTSFLARAEIVFQSIGDVMELRIVRTARMNFKLIVPNTIVWRTKNSDVTEPESKSLFHLN